MIVAVCSSLIVISHSANSVIIQYVSAVIQWSLVIEFVLIRFTFLQVVHRFCLIWLSFLLSNCCNSHSVHSSSSSTHHSLITPVSHCLFEPYDSYFPSTIFITLNTNAYSNSATSSMTISIVRFAHFEFAISLLLTRMIPIQIQYLIDC